MKNKLIYLILSLFIATSLVGCKDKVKHTIVIEEVETVVKWEEIQFKFKVTGETEEAKVAENSLEATLYKDGKVVEVKNVTTLTEEYSVNFTKLSVDTQYELVITASVNQKKVELFRKAVKTLLEGGREDDPIMINSVEDYSRITNQYAFYKLGQDLDFNGEEIPQSFVNGLRGQFDGDGFKLKNFKISYSNYSGIFGNMSYGSGVVKNLIIEGAIFDGPYTIGDRYGLLTREIGANAKITDITFQNIDVKAITRKYAKGDFGLVAGRNSGTVENITLDNVNFEIEFNDVYETSIGGVIGRNIQSGKISKINYASGDFNISFDDYSDYEDVQQTYFGTIVGNNFGKISEVVSRANLNIMSKGVTDTKKMVVVEGINFEVRAPSLVNGITNKNVSFVEKTDEVEVRFNHNEEEEIHEVLLNGADKTAEAKIDKKLIIDAAVDEIHVVVTYKIIDETAKLTISGDKMKILSATLGGTTVYDSEGEDELPEEWDFGTVVRIKGEPRYGKIINIKVNGINQVVDNDGVIEITLIRNIAVVVEHSKIKTICIGGIVGASKTIENVAYLGNINFNIRKPFVFFENYKLGGIIGVLNGEAKNIAIISSEVNVTNDSSLRTMEINRLIGNERPESSCTNKLVLNTTINYNGTPLDDLNVVATEMPENFFTSEFVEGLLS